MISATVLELRDAPTNGEGRRPWQHTLGLGARCRDESRPAPTPPNHAPPPPRRSIPRPLPRPGRGMPRRGAARADTYQPRRSTATEIHPVAIPRALLFTRVHPRLANSLTCPDGSPESAAIR